MQAIPAARNANPALDMTSLGDVHAAARVFVQASNAVDPSVTTQEAASGITPDAREKSGIQIG